MSSPSKLEPPADENSVQAKSNMPLKIGVMGGAGIGVPEDYLDRAFELGQAIASSGCVTITGACPGLPLAAARGANDCGGLVVGISPGLSLDEHTFKYEPPTAGHDILNFTGSGSEEFDTNSSKYLSRSTNNEH